MAEEDPSPTSNTATKADGRNDTPVEPHSSPTGPRSPFHYGYVPVGTAREHGDLTPRTPLKTESPRRTGPRPNPLERHLPPLRPRQLVLEPNKATISDEQLSTVPPLPTQRPDHADSAAGDQSNLPVLLPLELEEPDREPRILLSSQVPMHHYDARNYTAHTGLMASRMTTMFPVKDGYVLPGFKTSSDQQYVPEGDGRIEESMEKTQSTTEPTYVDGPPQEMFKADMEAAKILHKMSRDAWAEHWKTHGK